MNPTGANGSSFCGVVFGGGDQAVTHVPLLKSIINVVVIDASCRVSVTQTYQNQLDEKTPTARYVFPVPSRSAICAFSMMTAENRLICAQAKDRIEAMKEFEAAVDEGKAAALQEKISGDIFRISLGSIPAKGRFRTKTVFVMDLMNYDYLSNKVQLLLPLALAQRYGALPEQLEDAAGHLGRVKLKITVEVQMSGQILSIHSPSHEQGVFLEEYITHYGRPSRRRVTVKFNSTTFLDKDFELVIQANELERSRCFAETDQRLPGTVALQLMLIPHFQLPPIPEQEYLFLIDRSGSMHSGRLDMAIQCVSLLLKCLPNQNTFFNISNFDDVFEQLWPQSRPYGDKNVQEATAYVNSLLPRNGTEIATAMKKFLASRRTSMATAAFILTDGEVNPGEAQSARDVVLRSVSASQNSPLRLFILGIGNTVSSDVCERLATAGGGQYLLAVSQESILLKCTSLLRAGRTSTITDVGVDWMTDTTPNHRSSQPLVQQSPPESPLQEMYPSSRALFFAIIRTKSIPKQVVIRGKVDGKEVSIRVDVESSKFGRRLSDPPFIHTLAANRLIRDLEDGGSKGKLPETAQREKIVQLGEFYQLASSQTSFVAVDYGEVQPHLPVQHKSSPFAATVTSLAGVIWGYFTNPTTLFRSSSTTGRPRQGVPGGWDGSNEADSEVHSESDKSDTEYTDDEGESSGWSSDNTFSTLSSLESRSSVDVRKVRSPRRSGSTRRRSHVPSPQVPYAPLPATPLTTGRTERFKPLPINPRVAALVQEMSTSGSFALTDALAAIVGRDVVVQAGSWGDEGLAATALAVAYLEKNLGDHLEVCQLLTEKGMEFVKKHQNGQKFDEMLERARAAIRV